LDWEFLHTFALDMRYASLVRNAGLLMALSAALFVGCKKEKEQYGPSLIAAAEPGVVTGDLTLEPLIDTTLRFKLIAQKGSGKDDADLKDYSFTYTKGGANFTVYANRPAPNRQSFTIDTVVRVEGGANGEVRRYTFTVTDKNGKSASKSFKITFQSAPDNPPSGQIDALPSREYSNRDGKGTYLIYDHNSGSFNLTNRTGAENNPDQILFLYYYRDEDPKYHSVIAPDVLSNSGYDRSSIEWDRPWSTQTSLRLPPSGVNFDNVTYDGIRDAFENGQTVNDNIGDFNVGKRIKLLENRTLIAFKQTRAGKDIYGLIKIERLDDANKKATLSVKVRRPN
jgi:hypothetical protein